MKTIAYEYVTDYEIMYTMLTAMGYKITNVDHWQYTFANASGNEIVLNGIPPRRLRGQKGGAPMNCEVCSYELYDGGDWPCCDCNRIERDDMYEPREEDE